MRRTGRVRRPEAREFRCQTRLLPTFQLEEHMFLAGKVEENPCATSAVATIAPTSAPDIPGPLNSAIAARSIRSRVCSRRASRADGLT